MRVLGRLDNFFYPGIYREFFLQKKAAPPGGESGGARRRNSRSPLQVGWAVKRRGMEFPSRTGTRFDRREVPHP